MADFLCGTKPFPNFELKMLKTQSMRHLLFLFFAICSLSVHAQFFFGFPQQQPVQQQQEKYTAPSYKGGKSAIESFITKHFQQPVRHERMDGRVVVAVIVNPKGKPIETHIVRSVSDDLNAEAIRVCKKMKFKPATLGKKKVKGRIDITFPVKHGRVSFVNLPTIEV